MNYERRGNEVWCVSTGKKVAETADGEIRMEQYMSGPHLAGVKEFLRMEAEQEEPVPEFDPALGVNTPGLREYIEKRGLTERQAEELIRRLEKQH